jgi:hypothetical protein
MPTINLTDDELAAVTAANPAPRRRRQIPPGPAPRSLALRAGKVRRGAEKANPCATAAKGAAASPRHAAITARSEATRLAAQVTTTSPSLGI